MPPLVRIRAARAAVAAFAAFASAALVATPAAADVYRWRDAAGREHFAQQLHQVPPEHRAAARQVARTADAGETGGAIRYQDVPRRSATLGASREARAAQEPAPPAARAPSARECRVLQKQIARKEKVIRTHRGSVEANQRWADDIDRSPFSRRRYEVRAEEEARWLARAERDLQRFIDAQRRKGAPPGCLR
jgi:hypothetical protein